MTNHADLLRQALDALLMAQVDVQGALYSGVKASRIAAAIDAIRAELAAPVETVAMGVPVGWIDEFGNVFSLGAWVKSEVREKWKPLYTSPPAQPAPAPDARCDGGTCGLGGYCADCPKQQPAPAVPDDVLRALLKHNEELFAAYRARTAVPAVPAAPAVPAVRPLTDERVFADDNIMAINAELGLSMRYWMRIVRAIEQAHGITGDEP